LNFNLLIPEVRCISGILSGVNEVIIDDFSLFV